MAITPSLIGHFESSAAASSFTTGSMTVSKGDILCLDMWSALAVSGTPLPPTSIVGLGCTWTLVDSYNATASFERHSRYRARAPAAFTGTIAFTFAASQDAMLMALTKFANADTSGDNASGAFVQTTRPAPVASGTTITSTLATFAAANSLSFQSFLIDIATPTASGTPEAGFTELTDNPTTSPGFGEGYALQIAYRADNGDLTYTGTSSAAMIAGGLIASEIRHISGPRILQHPSSTPKQVGDTLYLDVLADLSDGAVTYQWQDNSGGSLADIAGQTGQNLTVTGLTIGMNTRQYRVNVTNANGTTTSNTFVLRVSDRADANYFLRDVPSDANPNDVRLYDRPDVVSASGFNGTLAVTLDNVTLAATAQALVKGTLANTLDAITVAATAQTLVKGTLATTLGGTTVAATAQALVKGSLATTLDDVTLAATGTVGSVAINGNLAVTLDDVTVAATAQARVKGNLSTTLDAVTVAATAQALIKGTLANTLADLTVAAAAQALVKGSLATTLGDVTVTATGTNFSDPGGGGGDDGHTRHRMAVITVGRLMNS